MMVRGLGTVIYHVADLNRAKTCYTQAFQQEPYFDEPFYVGFNIGGYELGLDSDFTLSKPGPGGGVAYWRVEQIDAAVLHFASVPHRIYSLSKRPDNLHLWRLLW